MIRKYLVVGLLLTLTLNLKAQLLKDTVKLSEVYVTSKRQVTDRALYIKNIDTLALASASNTDMSSLLLKNSSLYIKSYGNSGLATASFRGTSASHTQVLWNGMTINSPLGGQADLSLIPVFFVDEVSLYYGSSSLAKTSGGLGGCISMTNNPTWNGGNNLSFTQLFGSYGYLVSQAKYSHSSEKFVSTTRLFLDKAKNNFRYYNSDKGSFDYEHQKNAEYIKDGFLQEFYYKINKRQFAGIKLMDTWSDRNLPPIMSTTFYEGRTEYQKDNNINLMAEWKYYGNKSNMFYNFGYVRSVLDYRLNDPRSLGGNLGGNYNNRRISKVFFNNFNFQYNIDSKTVIKSSANLILTRAAYQNIEEDSTLNVERNDLAVQTSLHHEFSPKLSVYLLMQQKIVDAQLKPFVAGTGLEYKINRSGNLLFKSNVGRNLHIPNLDDIYFSYIANKNLKPEVGYQGDAGFQSNFSLKGVSYQFEVTAFSASVENWILWQQTGHGGLWMARNIKLVFSRGLEVNGTIKGEVARFNYQLKGNYSFTRTTNEDELHVGYGMQLPYIPRHVGNLLLLLEKKGYSTEISGHYTGERYTSSAEDDTYPLDSYYVVDIGLGKKFKIKEIPLDLSLRINNLFNTQYQVIGQRAMPGINYSLSLSTNLSNIF
jgi:outer membrane cobalamin receptor